VLFAAPHATFRPLGGMMRDVRGDRRRNTVTDRHIGGSRWAIRRSSPWPPLRL